MKANEGHMKAKNDMCYDVKTGRVGRSANCQADQPGNCGIKRTWQLWKYEVWCCEKLQGLELEDQPWTANMHLMRNISGTSITYYSYLCSSLCMMMLWKSERVGIGISANCLSTVKTQKWTLLVLYYVCPHIVWCEKLEGLEDGIYQLPFNSKNVLLKQKPNIKSTRVHI
jgi:hypothetical protein